MRNAVTIRDEVAEFTRVCTKWWVNMDRRKGTCEDKRLEVLAIIT
jgi:hypothetical protein